MIQVMVLWVFIPCHVPCL